ncbi:MAG TPA: ThuA domain-containing protein [Cytophagales bacterium]|nr:ThuA domain-containing protein [Cytophagales bacterium]
MLTKLKKSRGSFLSKLLFIMLAIGVFYACKTVSKTSPTAQVTSESDSKRILVFTKTKGYYHESIPTGIAALQKLGAENGFVVDTTKNAAYFNEDSLKKYNTIVFLSTSGNVLNADQQVAFARYIQAGGGFVGIHAATTTEYEWPWFNQLVGAYFLNHPKIQKATVHVTDTTHISTKSLPQKWERTDEWYNYKSIQPGLKVLAQLDEDSYEGGEHGVNHPIAWYHEFDGGRAFYTGGGHTKESYSEPLFMLHILGGIKYAMANSSDLDFGKSYAVKTPEENRFTKVLLSNDLNEPMELAVAPDGRVFFVERSGNFYMFDPVSNQTKLVHKFNVLPEPKEIHGNGLLGVTVDPDFATNNYIYFFYTPDKKPLAQNISRFVISKDGMLDLSSEKVIIKVPIELESSAHTGGSLTWDKDKNLYISTGDNTVPFESDGFAPIDERKGRITFDAQRSAGNPNDLRGKILKIHPEADGSYTIPEGNLFPKGTPGTRPEIYTMGCRNPYRISVDQETSILYWGEIGPDSGEDGPQGPRGYDEINQARKPGFYGWPYFVGDNKAYKDYNFETKEVGASFNPDAPVNESPLNTGIKNLPPTQKAMIWYPYDKSVEFPQVGLGGRSSMAGPVYHFDESLDSDIKFPEYYDKALFIYDWMRNWVFAVRLDSDYNYKSMEPFMSLTGDFKRPIDLEVGPDGAFYMLEYGSVYGIDNVDARLVRIEFNPGNRAPVANVTAKDSIGAAPLKVALSSKESYDFDEDDQLKYEWRFEGNQVGSTEANPEYTFQKNGIYKASLKITDPSGLTDTDTMEIIVGNTLPEVVINTPGNSTFFFDGEPLKYSVEVKDKEDKVIDSKKVEITLNYIPKVSGSNAEIGHQKISANFNLGKNLMENSDCKACHQIDKKSVGPAFMAVAQKYKGNNNAVPMLANKVITGGGGVWGEHAMNAHPQLSKEEATEIVKYVLALGQEQAEVKLPQTGSLPLKDHLNKKEEGRYILTASYTDNGGEAIPLSNSTALILRPSKIEAENADVVTDLKKNWNVLGSINHKSFFVLKDVDLTGIKNLKYRYASKDKDATIEVRLKSRKGPVISTLNYKATGDWKDFKEVTAPLQPTEGIHDLYFVFKDEQEPNEDIGSLDWVEFLK